MTIPFIPQPPPTAPGGRAWPYRFAAGMRHPVKWLTEVCGGAAVYPLLIVFGLALQGRLFPFAPSEPLVALAAIADVGVGLPNLIARGLGYGAGQVIAVTWEYGNTFTIVAGLLNMLVVLDAFDVMEGRK